MERRDESPVLFFKQQGKVLADIGTNIGLSANDFALVIQTPLQSEMLQNCGDNKFALMQHMAQMHMIFS